MSPPPTDAPAAAAPAPATTTEQVATALTLGQQMTQLYLAVAQPPAATPAATVAPTAPAAPAPNPVALPPLTADQQSRLQLLSVAATLYSFNATIAAAGLAVPSAQPLIDDATPTVDSITNLHAEILETLTATDATVATAYQLGCALASVCQATARDPSQLAAALAHGRIDDIRALLQRLRSALPPHAGQAVIGALNNWEDWLAAGMIGKLAMRWDRDGPTIGPAFTAQCSEWFSLLTGQKNAQDLLSVDDYVDAGEALLQRYRDLGCRFLAQWWPYVAAGLVVAIGIVALFFIFSSGDTRGIGTITTLLASVGLTAKAAISTLEKTASNVEDSLWQAELDAAVVDAATTLPEGDQPVVTPVVRPFHGAQRKAAANAKAARAQAIATRTANRAAATKPEVV